MSRSGSVLICEQIREGGAGWIRIDGARRHKRGQTVAIKTIIHFYSPSKKRARNNTEKEQKANNYRTRDRERPPRSCGVPRRALSLRLPAASAPLYGSDSALSRQPGHHGNRPLATCARCARALGGTRSSALRALGCDGGAAERGGRPR